MYSEPAPRAPLTPEKRRQLALTLLLMLGSLIGAVVWSARDVQHSAWVARVVKTDLEFTYDLPGELRDIHLEITTMAGAVYIYDRTTMPGHETITVPLRDFHHLRTGAPYDPAADRPDILRITATRGGKALSVTKPLHYNTQPQRGQ